MFLENKKDVLFIHLIGSKIEFFYKIKNKVNNRLRVP